MLNFVFAILALILTALSGLVFTQYRAFKDETQRLVEIREEYRTYTNAFRKILRENQRLKDGDNESEETSEEDVEKKKETPFLVVNREPEYLKGSMYRYLKQKKLKQVMRRLQNTGQLQVAYVEPQPKRYKSRRARRLYRTYPLVTAQMQMRRESLAQKRAQYSDLSLQWPVDRSSFWLSSFFGYRRKPDRTWGFHYGIDMAAIKGTPVMAAGDGVIIEAGVNKGFGKTVVIMHNNKYRTRYAHLDRIYTRVGRHVQPGERIGTVGDTGLVRKRGRYASHLHLEVSVYGKRVNPLYFFS